MSSDWMGEDGVLYKKIGQLAMEIEQLRKSS